MRALRHLGSDKDAVVRLRMSAIGSPWTHTADGNRYAMHDIARFLIARLKQDAEAHAGATITTAAVAVPSDFTVEQMDMLRIAATGAGFPDVSFENSSVAAATAAGLLSDDGRPVMVFDLGGTTLDVAALDGEAEPLAFRVNRSIGAQMWAGRLVDRLVEEVRADHGVDLYADPQAIRSVTDACDKAVEELSTGQQTRIRLPSLAIDPHATSINLTRPLLRSELMRATLDLMRGCRSAVEQTLAEAGPDAMAGARLLLTGGGTRIGIVADMFANSWPEIVAGADPPGLVSRGAALLAARSAGLDVGRSQ